jgi:hypothetical protein
MTTAECAENQVVDESRLTPDEDAELRLLHSLRSFGAVARSMGARYEALRSRDRRKNIRDPDDTTVVQPVEKGPWASQPTTPVIPAENPSEEFEPMLGADELPRQPIIPGAQRTDTREVLAAGEMPEQRRRFFR